MTTNISRNTTERFNNNNDMNSKNILNDFINKHKFQNNINFRNISESNKSKLNEVNSVSSNNIKNKEKFNEVKYEKNICNIVSYKTKQNSR